MAWQKICTESLTGPDGGSWDIDLLGGEKRIIDPSSGKPAPFMKAGNVECGVMASCYTEKGDQFWVLAWVPSDRVKVVQTAVMEEARRRIQQGDWSARARYEI